MSLHVLDTYLLRFFASDSFSLPLYSASQDQNNVIFHPRTTSVGKMGESKREEEMEKTIDIRLRVTTPPTSTRSD